MSIAVNNAELYRLIRDQAEDLGHMFRKQQIETSRSQAILEAVADGVIVTDANRRITLFNAAAERILKLDRSQIIDQSLPQFSGLFGQAAKTWMETIQNWSNNVYNLVTKRAVAETDATMEWVDGNLGSKLTMKYPAVYMMEPGARGEILSIAFSSAGQHQGRTLVGL